MVCVCVRKERERERARAREIATSRSGRQEGHKRQVILAAGSEDICGLLYWQVYHNEAAHASFLAVCTQPVHAALVHDERVAITLHSVQRGRWKR